jgi:hypothetical protein
LQDENIDVVLSHPKKTKAIASARIKNQIHAILRNFNFHCAYADLFGKKEN